MIIPDKSIRIHGSMVPALLELRKTRGRLPFADLPSHDLTPCKNGKDEWLYTNDTRDFYKPVNMPFRLGQRLWVQEDWRAPSDLDALDADGIGCKDGKPRSRDRWCPVRYEWDWAYNNKEAWAKDSLTPGILRPGSDMPRFASRITLTVSKIRVERLREISDLESLLEGIRRRKLGDIRDRIDKPEAWLAEPDKAYVYLSSDDNACSPFKRPIQAYRVWWDKQVSDRAHTWRNNPWVIVLDFSVKLANIDDRKEKAA